MLRARDFRRWRACVWGAAIGLLSLPTVMWAQARDSVASPVYRLVVPGDSLLRGARLRADTVTYALTIFQGSDEIQVGRLRDVLTVDTVSGGPSALRVQALQRGTLQLVDSTRTDLRTLAPQLRGALQQNRRVHVEFTGRRVRGTVGPLDVPPVVLDTTLAVPFFDASSWDLLLRALPLEEGFAARFAMYDTDAGLREYRVQVTGRTTVQGEDAHVVVLTLARNRESVVWVSAVTGQVLQIETMLGETAMLRQVRVAR